MDSELVRALREASARWIKTGEDRFGSHESVAANLATKDCGEWLEMLLVAHDAREGGQIDPVAHGKEIAARERLQALRRREQAAQPQPGVAHEYVRIAKLTDPGDSLRLGNEYERIEIGHEQRVEIEAMTLGIYTHMINRGATLQEVLTAIYLIGFSDALNSTREDNAQ